MVQNAVSNIMRNRTMPVKFKATETIVNRETKKKVLRNHYMHAQTLDTLKEAYIKESGKFGRGTLRQKVANELVKRGVEPTSIAV